MKEVIRKVINNWDPIGLFPEAPKDEYNFEIRDLNNKFEELKDKGECSKEKLADEIHKIFLASFGDYVFYSTKEECLEVSDQILCELSYELHK